MNLIQKSRKLKFLSPVVAVVFLSSTFFPSISYGLSTGPGQPELEGFAPVGMDNMVDLFTGDFSYNLPLMNVPGPGGGYPLNLAYAAGPGMEQEASWVGLGWSLNPGAVNREMRGLPDDFNGQQVTKKLHLKPDRTFGANIAAANIEAFGADATKFGLELSANVNLIYNSYKGFDARAGIGFALTDIGQSKASGSAYDEDPIDTDTGEKGAEKSYPERAKDNQVDGEKKVSFANPMHTFNNYYKSIGSNMLSRVKNVGGALSSVSAPSITDIRYDHPMTSNSFTFNVKTGLEIVGISGDLQVDVFFKSQKVSPSGEVMKVPAFGYLNSEYNLGRENSGLMDFTQSNQSIITPSSKILAIPNHTYDVFHVKSQGVAGSVRPYKGGVSLLIDPTVKSDKKAGGGGAELNSAGLSTGFGVNINGGYTESYSGPWKSGDEALTFLKTTLDQKQAQSPLLEPYYFQFGGELCSQVNANTIHVDEKAGNFDLGTKMGVFSTQAKLLTKLKESKTSNLGPSNSYRTEREKRAKNFQTLTEKEASNYSYSREVYDIVSETPYPINFATSSADPNSKLIGAIHVTDESGGRYIYGIPAKNNVHKQSTFSIESDYGSGVEHLVPKTTVYNSRDNSSANENGTDNYFSSTETPAYAHTFLLTEVLSEDYVDINNNGPDPSDFGTYTKFDYSVSKGHKSKSPVVGANYLPGNLSNDKDDKATIIYFEKDLYYLKSISTKTHIAVFETSPRNDAWGVSGENGTPTSSQNQYKLDRITLYNLADYKENGTSAIPVKTVNFQYNYSLCGGTNLKNATSGKLTLEKVWFSVGSERTKMSLSPYQFEYDSQFNYPYNENHVDRWSTYQHDSVNSFGSNVLYPYTEQRKEKADANAAAWCLSKVTLPTGGEINIQYESDSYQYVQNRKAQNMYEIEGFVHNALATYEPSTMLYGGGSENLYMVINLNEEISAGEVAKYFEGVENAYFKVFARMKKFGQPCLNCPPSQLSKCTEPCNTPFSDGTYAYDYIDGYINFDNTPTLYPSTATTSDRVIVKLKQDGDNYHPISKAGWMSMQLSRPDLLDDSGISLDGFGAGFSNSLLNTVSSIVTQALKFLMDSSKYFRKAEDKGWCNLMNKTEGLKSIIRLNNSGDKIGGGHRVKKIVISDEWDNLGGDSDSATYGQEYFYTLPDGSSSGVAQYEPLTGGEENPFRQPVKYKSEQLFAKDDLYTELPMQEALYPSATVGYSRVVVKNLANEFVTTGGAAIQVSEFYTAKDYPIETFKTEIKKVNTGLTEKLVEYIGNKNFFQPGFSQGFSIILNDMHGKKKSEATYSAYAIDIATEAPVQKTEYFYRTTGDYFPGKANKLDNSVTVYLGDDFSEIRTIGVSQDTYVHMRESNERSISGDIDADIDYTAPFLVFPAAWPTVDYAYGMTRTVTMNKVINKNAILEKIKTTVNGAQTITENLAYDYETGEPVVSSVTNEYGNRIFNYNQMAKWHYYEMGGQYQNTGLVIRGDINNYKQYLSAGDLLMDASGNKAWVTSIGQTALQCRDSSGNLVPSLDGYKIIRSGFGNNLKATVGHLQTTRDPRQIGGLGMNLPFLEVYNDSVSSTLLKKGDLVRFIGDCELNRLDTLIYDSIHATTVSYGQCTDMPYTTITQGTYTSVTDSTTRTYPSVSYTYITGPVYDTVYDPLTQIYEYKRKMRVKVCYPTARDYSFIFLVYGADDNLFNCMFIDHLSLHFEDVDASYDPALFKLYHLGGNKVVLRAADGYSKVGQAQSQDEPYTGDLGSCFVKCIKGVLNSTATNYADDLKVTGDLPASVSGHSGYPYNKYQFGLRGIYKPKQNLFYPEKRTQGGAGFTAALPHSYNTFINWDGEYFKYYYYNPTGSTPGKWKVANETTHYDPHGNPVEEKDALGNYSAVLFDHDGSLPVAVAQNAFYEEIGYDGFEAHDDIFGTPAYSVQKKSNHLNFGTNVELSSAGDAHSGKFSMKLPTSSTNSTFNSMGLALVNGKQYLVQAWHKTGSGGSFDVSNGTSTVSSKVITADIEGWELIELTFTAGPSNSITLKGANSQYDDFRILPVSASLKSFVYDPVTHKLIAGLDENHFATIYNYDRDQVLIQVKKETERGIKTIQSTQRVTSQIQ